MARICKVIVPYEELMTHELKTQLLVRRWQRLWSYWRIVLVSFFELRFGGGIWPASPSTALGRLFNLSKYCFSRKVNSNLSRARPYIFLLFIYIGGEVSEQWAPTLAPGIENSQPMAELLTRYRFWDAQNMESYKQIRLHSLVVK